MFGLRRTLLGWAVFVSVGLVTVASGAFAADVAPAEISPDAAAELKGIAIGGWLVYPKVFFGGTYDSNVHQDAKVSGDNKSGWTARIVPSYITTYDGGIHKATVYGVVDARFFDMSTLAASAGVSYTYEAMRDLIFNFQGNYTRQTDVFSSALNFNNGAIGPTTNSNIPIVINPFGATASINPIPYNQFTSGGSATKTFGQAFVTLTGVAYHISYDHGTSVTAPFNTSHDGTSFWAGGRIGYDVTPQMYVYAEVDGIFQTFTNSLFNTNGYRVIGGVGSNDPNSLFKGELYGGYHVQQQTHQSPIVLGHSQRRQQRGVWWPSELLSDPVLDVDRAGRSDVGGFDVPDDERSRGDPNRVTTAMLQTNYALSQWWWVGARAGYTSTDFFGSSLAVGNQHGWMAGASFNYEIWRNLALTLDYQFTDVKSDMAGGDFNRSVYTAGLTYKY